MRTIAIVLLMGGAAAAQTWEAGVVGGGGIYRNATFTAPAGEAKAGFAAGPAFGGFLTQHGYRHLSGEIRYLYQRSGLKVTAGGQHASFKGDSHAVHYDFLIHTSGADSTVRPYVAGGAGFKSYSGTGTEVMLQPLSNYALLTQTSEWKPLVTAGAGVRWRVSRRTYVRLEIRDYMTPFPSRVVAPGPGASGGGWLHDFVPTFAIGFTL